MILFLSTNDTLGGAATVTFRLVEELRRRGTDARMLVARKDSDAGWVARVSPLAHMTAKIAERAEILISRRFDTKGLWKVSTGRFGARVSRHPWVKEADTVVLEWINQGFVSLGDIRKITEEGKEIVWMMHDLWCATGICHLPGECTHFKADCGECPLLDKRECHNDLSRRVWRLKMDLWGNADKCRIRFVAVSRWQRDEAAASRLLRDREIDVLPHAFPVENYPTAPCLDALPHELEFLSAMPHGRKLIVMGAARLDDPVKDLPMAVKALNRMAELHPEAAADCEVVFFGDIRDSSVLDTLKVSWRHIGMMTSENLRQLYAAATVVLSTSRYETMGATLMEGMAAGATPVTFGKGGQTDIVTDGENGYIASYGSADSVADCLARALTAPFPRNAQHDSVARRFSADAVASRFLEIIARK